MEYQELINTGYLIILIIHTVVLYVTIHVKQTKTTLNTSALVFKMYKIIPIVVFIIVVVAFIMLGVAIKK